MTKPLEGEEDLWATFGMTFPTRMLAQIALDDELAGLEARPPAPPPDPFAFATDSGAGYQMLTEAEQQAEKARALMQQFNVGKQHDL